MVPLLITLLSIALLVGTVYILLREPELTSAGAGIAIGVVVAALPLILPMTSFFSALSLGIGGVAITYGVMTIRHHREISALRQQIIDLQTMNGFRPIPAGAPGMGTSGPEYGPPADPFEPAAGAEAPPRPRAYGGGYPEPDSAAEEESARRRSQPGFNSLGRYFRKDGHGHADADERPRPDGERPTYMSEDEEILALAERSKRAKQHLDAGAGLGAGYATGSGAGAAAAAGADCGRPIRPAKGGEAVSSLTRLARRRGH